MVLSGRVRCTDGESSQSKQPSNQVARYLAKHGITDASMATIYGDQSYHDIISGG